MSEPKNCPGWGKVHSQLALKMNFFVGGYKHLNSTSQFCFAIMNLNIPPEILPPNVFVTIATKFLGYFHTIICSIIIGMLSLGNIQHMF